MAVALATAVPLSRAVTKPVELIDALSVPLDIDHVTVLFVALAGNTAAISCNVPPSVTIADPPETVILDTRITWLDIVIVSVP